MNSKEINAREMNTKEMHAEEMHTGEINTSEMNTEETSSGTERKSFSLIYSGKPPSSVIMCRVRSWNTR